MNLRYYAEFRSIKEKLYRIEIYTSVSGKAEELTLSDSPCTVDYESESVYKPLKMSNAVVSIITDKVLTDLYTGENQGVRVMIRNLSDNVLEWFGYVSPNLYSSDFVNVNNSVDVEAVDTISSLENIKYSLIDGMPTFRSFQDIVTRLLDFADPDKVLNNVYVHDTNRISKSSTSSIFENVYILERNFFDELDEPSDCRSVIEEISKYLGYSLIQWKGAYYFIDYHFLSKGYSGFFQYNRTTGKTTKTNLDISIRNVMDIGIAEGTATIALGDVYNKITVVANMNNIKKLIPNLFDESDLRNQNNDQSKYYEVPYSANKKNYMLLLKYLRSAKNWGTKCGVGILSEELEEVTASNVNNIQWGSFFQSATDYLIEDGEPASLNYIDYLTFARPNTMLMFGEKGKIELLSPNYLLFSGGYLIVNLLYKYSGYPYPNSTVTTSEEKYVDNKYTMYLLDTRFRCRLRIGDYYYNGEEWASYSEYLANEAYYNQKIGSEQINGVTKWYIQHSDGSKEYIEKEEYDKIDLKDCFLLVHKNKVGDKIFDTPKKLTNSVSYKYNLSDSEEGVLIKLPSFVINGYLTFVVYEPESLGRGENPVTNPGGNRTPTYCHVSDLSLIYTNVKDFDSDGEEVTDTDTIHTNVINDNNVTEMSDLTLLVNSNSKNIPSYSNCATKNGANWDYVREFYNPIEDMLAFPERILIDKLYKHYCSPKFSYKNTLCRGFSILNRIKENSIGKTMVVNSMFIDYSNERCTVNIIDV